MQLLELYAPPPPKKNVMFHEMKLSSPHQNLNKTIYTLIKTPLGETGYLSNLFYYYLLKACSFLILIFDFSFNLIFIWNFFIVKICNFISMRFYFGFQKNFIVARLAYKFFFNISTELAPNSVTFF